MANVKKNTLLQGIHDIKKNIQLVPGTIQEKTELLKIVEKREKELGKQTVAAMQE